MQHVIYKMKTRYKLVNYRIIRQNIDLCRFDTLTFRELSTERSYDVGGWSAFVETQQDSCSSCIFSLWSGRKENSCQNAFNSERVRSKSWKTGVGWNLGETAELDVVYLPACSKSLVIRGPLFLDLLPGHFFSVQLFSRKGCGTVGRKVKAIQTEFDGGCNVLLSMVANTPIMKVPTTMLYFRNVISRVFRRLLLSHSWAPHSWSSAALTGVYHDDAQELC